MGCQIKGRARGLPTAGLHMHSPTYYLEGLEGPYKMQQVQVENKIKFSQNMSTNSTMLLIVWQQIVKIVSDFHNGDDLIAMKFISDENFDVAIWMYFF